MPLISKLKYNANTKVTEWSSHHISNKLLYHYFLNYFYFLMHHIFLYEWKVFKILKTSLEACFFWHELIFFQKVYSANSITEELLLKGAKELYFTYYSCVVIILLNTGLYKSAFSTNSFRKLIFLSFCAFCLCFLLALCRLRFNLHKLCNICIINIYVVGVRRCMFLFSLIRNNL